MTIVVAGLLTPAVASAQDTPSTPAPGIKRVRRVTATQHINILTVDLCAPGVSIRATAVGERQRTVGSFAAAVGAEAAINGDFFSFNNYSTNGPSMHAGAQWGGGDGTYVSPIQFGPGQVAIPGHESTAGVGSWAKEVVSGHPSILVAGARRDNNGDPLCTARHPRTALGFNAARDKLILAVIDGRASNRIGMTCDEMVTLMKEFGAHDAVNLDGGGSSTMVVKGTVVNIPSDGTQRVVANHLAVRAKGTGEPAHCPGPRYAAKAMDLTAPPAEMVSGEEAVVAMEFQNEGHATWDVMKTRVGTQGPQDRESAFFKEENWIAPNRPTAVDATSAAGTAGKFTWAMVAPEVSETTTFVETFQLVQEGVMWFGPEQTMTIVVHPRSGPTGPGGGEEPGGEEPGGEGGGCSTSGGLGLGGLVGLLALRRRRRR